LSLVSFAAPASVESFNRGNDLYREGKYTEAVASYERAIAMGATDPALYYNLGNAYFKDGRIGKAILYYERALRLSPRDEEIRLNLRFANLRKVDKETAESGVISGIIAWVDGLMSLNGWYLLSTIFYLLAIGSGIGLLFLTGNLRHFCYRLLVTILVLLTLGGGVFFLKLRATVWTEAAIVVTAEAEAMSGPGGDYTKVFTLHEGTKVIIQRRSAGWALVRLASGLGGWVKEGTVETI
jgi:tetratricopeptide (TPR) repeat protein